MSDTKMELLAQLDEAELELEHSQMMIDTVRAIPVVSTVLKSHLDKRQRSIRHRQSRVKIAQEYLQKDLKF